MMFVEVMLAPPRIQVPMMTEDENPRKFKHFQELFRKKKEIHFRKPLSPHTKWTHSKLFHFYIQVPPQLLIMDLFLALSHLIWHEVIFSAGL